MDYLGPFSQALNITVTDINHQKAVSDKITNVFVIELRSICCSDEECATSLKYLCTNKRIKEAQTLRMNVSRLQKKFKTMKRNKDKRLDEILKADFFPPVKDQKINFDNLTDVQIQKLKKSEEKTAAILRENRSLKRKLETDDALIKCLQNDIKTLEDTYETSLNLLNCLATKYQKVSEESGDLRSLQSESQKWFDKFRKAASKVDELSEKFTSCKTKLSTYDTRNLHKREKRMKNTNKYLKEQLIESKKEIEEKKGDLNSALDFVIEQEVSKMDLQENLKAAKKDSRRLKKRISKLRRKQKKKNEQRNEKNPIASDLQERIQQYRCQISDYQKKIKDLEQLQNIIEQDKISTFEQGRYINEVRQTIMTLLTECNVSMSKVNSVITVVLSNLAGKLPVRLPSKGVLSRLLVEAKVVANQQLYKAMVDGTDPQEFLGNCLHQDATTKNHRHYQGFEVTLPNKECMTLGMTEVGKGDSKSLTEAFRETVDEIVDSVNGTDVSDNATKVAKLISSINTTMSDQGPICPAFNDQLLHLRTALLPIAVENWESFSDEIKQSLASMSNFYCKLHVVANFATEADKCLKLFASNVFDGKSPYALNNNESGASRLVHTACKAFTRRGSDKAGVFGYWDAYLSEKNMKSKLETFIGHRFNILFYDAGAVYFHRQDITDFLDKWIDHNELLKSVQFDIQQKVYVSGVRAMGIIDKIVTGPMWRLFEKTESILDLNSDLYCIQQKLQQWALDAQPLLEGDTLFPEEFICIHRDEIYEELFKDTEDATLETFTRMSLELQLNGILLLFERQTKDQLPGGKYWNPTDIQVKSAKNIPRNNMVSERDMGSLDLLLRMKPASTTLSLEAVIMWVNNKTSSWLQSMNEIERIEVIDSARKMAPTLKAKYKEKMLKLKRQKVEMLKKKQEEKVRKQKKSHEDLVKLTNEITAMGGVWYTDIDEKVALIPIIQQKNTLYKQLCFHKKILKSKGQKELFQKSAKHMNYSTQQMIENLKDVISLNPVTDASEISESESEDLLQYKDISEIKENVDAQKRKIMKSITDYRKKLLEQAEA